MIDDANPEASPMVRSVRTVVVHSVFVMKFFMRTGRTRVCHCPPLIGGGRVDAPHPRA
jgi:hypothetical protein